MAVLVLFGLALLLNVSNVSAANVTADQVANVSGTVKSSIETNHALPSTVNVSGNVMNMSNYLGLSTKAILNINSSNSNTSITIKSFGGAPSPSETVTSRDINQAEYLDMANRVRTYMDTNGRAPNYLTQTSTGSTIRYESLIYMFSQILNSYKITGVLPDYITVTPWSIISNSTTKFITPDQISTASGSVKSFVETNHRLPSYVTISTSQVTMPQFLKLSTKALLNINANLYASLVLKSFGAAATPSETITKGSFDSGEYMDIASHVNSYMDSNGNAPNYASTSLGNIRFESLVYLYSQIMNSYGVNNKTLPDYIIANPWSVVSNSSTVFFSIDQIKDAATRVKAFINTNNRLPSYVTISTSQVTMPQFLKLSTTEALNINGKLNTSLILESVGDAPAPHGDITNGEISSEEYIDMANRIVSFINANGRAPNYANETSLGNSTRFESLIYMYSQIMDSYSNQTLPESITMIPWAAVTNSTKVFNFRTQEVFNTIQAAINDVDTLNDDTITLGEGPFSENVIVNKKLTIKPLFESATVNALNAALPVFTVNVSGTTISGLIIRGSTGSSGIYINATNTTISENNITGNLNGIYINNSTDAEILGNTISNNNADGIVIYTGSKNSIIDNIVTYNGHNGITINGSAINTIKSNIISSNSLDGIYINNSSTTINLNRIAGNSRYGLYKLGNGTVDAKNNWWGSNSPVVSSTSPSDINIAGGTVTYNPWLVLRIISLNTVTHGTYTSDIIADLTYNNQGLDSSLDDDYVLDGILVNFSTTLGTIDATASTTDGIATSTLSSSVTAGLANVSATLDRQTVSMTKKVFSSIQAAINGASNGDTIEVVDGTYTENIVLNKLLNIVSVNSGNATIQAANSSANVITVNSGGSGSIIQGFTVKGATGTNAYGIYLNNANNCTIADNIVTNNWRGIDVANSNSTTVSGNIITNSIGDGLRLDFSNNSTVSRNNATNNGWNGILLAYSKNNTVLGNTATNNVQEGIYLGYSDNNSISGNIVTYNGHNGIYPYYSNNNTITENNIANNVNHGIYLYYSSAKVNFNRITRNGGYELYNEGNGTVNATNNWWGSNNNPSSEIQNVGTGSVTYNPWLVLNVTSSCDRSNREGANYNYIITADLTRNNQGEDTTPTSSESSPYDPYEIPLDFNTTLGTISTSTINVRGKSSVTLSSSAMQGIANVATTLDNQQILLSVNVTSINVLGIHNTRTGQGFETIQAAIDNANTQNSDTITLADGTYTENIIVSKRITLTPETGARVFIQPSDGTDPVIKINSGGNGSTIRGLTITGGSYGIYMDSVSNCNITGNSISENFNGIYLINSTNNTITGNTITDTGVGITYFNSNNTTITGNNITHSEIQNVLMIDPTGIVMSNSASNCGPASLATVLQKLGINVSQDVLATIAGTDDDGTTMYGLVQAARQQGVIARGLKLTVNQLRPGNIVYLDIAGEKHYSIITSINGTIVYLADTDLGNINMTLADFTAAYIQDTLNGYGYALLVTNNSTNPQLSNNNTLTDNEMDAIKGTGRYVRQWNSGQYNSRIRSIASVIRRSKSSATSKARAIFNWVNAHIFYHGHRNTLHSINQVLNWHRGNCVEQARLVICLARVMGLTARFVHKSKGRYCDYHRGKKTFPGHVWAQIKCGSRWIDLDPSWGGAYFGWHVDPITWKKRDYHWLLGY